MKKITLIVACLGVTILAKAQDSIRIRNRHTNPDTTERDTTKLNGGALLDSIHTTPKTQYELEKMQRPTDSIPKHKKLSGQLSAQEDLLKEISALENRIVLLKKKQTLTASQKSQIASVENKKNELKQRIKTGEVNQPNGRQKFDAEINLLKEKLQSLEK